MEGYTNKKDKEICIEDVSSTPLETTDLSGIV